MPNDHASRLLRNHTALPPLSHPRPLSHPPPLLSAEPWYHLASIVGFGYLGNALGHMYDDTNAVLNERMMAYARLPSWTYSQLSEKELDAELRQDRLEELRAKYKALALLEEKEYLESGAGAKVGKKAEAGLR